MIDDAFQGAQDIPTARPRRFIYLTLAVALILNLIKLGGLPLPDWVALLLVLWCVQQPQHVGIFTGFVMGILMDCVVGNVLCQHALAYSFLTYIANGLSKRILCFQLSKQALHVLGILFAAAIVLALVALTLNQEFPPWYWFLSTLFSSLLWAPLSILLLPRYRRGSSAQSNWL